MTNNLRGIALIWGFCGLVTVGAWATVCLLTVAGLVEAGGREK